MLTGRVTAAIGRETMNAPKLIEGWRRRVNIDRTS
jgi:hypothetical protein